MLALLGLCSAAFTPSALPAMPPSSTTTACVAQQQRRQAVMITPKGNSDPNFDPDAVDPEAVRRTVIKTGAVWAVVGSVAALVASSGKEFNKDNAPGPTPACHTSIQGQRPASVVFKLVLSAHSPRHGASVAFEAGPHLTIATGRYAEVAERKAAQKKASLDAYKARVDELKAQKAAGVNVAPPKPWQ